MDRLMVRERTNIAEQASLAQVHYCQCGLCEHRCGADRAAGERGPCHAGVEARVYRHRIESGEELELIPSHLFYLSGCDLRCAFCIAEMNAFDPSRGVPLAAEWFAGAVTWGQTQGARNVQFVGGEPTIHLPAILDVLAHAGEAPPIVWKSDFYGTPEAFALLDGVADVYVADFKFGNDTCAQQIAGVERYVETITRNLSVAARQGDLIVRHLLLPGHFECCFRPIVGWMRSHLPRAKFSVRDGYLPRWRARRDPILSRHLPKDEGPRARTYADDAGLRVII